MDRNDLVRVGTVAAVVGGVAMLLAGVTGFMQSDDADFSVVASTGAWLAQMGLMWVGAVAFLVAMPAFYLVHVARSRPLALTIYASGTAAFAILTSLAFVLFTVPPTFATAAPEVLDSEDGPGGPLGTAFMVGFPLFLVLMLVFTIAAFAGRVLPKGALVLLAVALAGDFAVQFLPGDVPWDGRIVAGAAFAWLGWALWSGRTVAGDGAGAASA